MERKEFIIEKAEKLSVFALNNCEGLFYSAFMKVLRKKDVKVNGKRVEKDVSLQTGDRVEIYYNKVTLEKYKTIFKDENILVIDKKSGYTSEEIFADLEKEFGEVYFIHRLDRNTSGIMLFAFNKKSEESLLYGFKQRTFTKKYLAETYGKLEKKEDILTAYLKKDEEKSLVYIKDQAEKGYTEIKTGYKVIEEKENSDITEITLFTGKTHQIRAQMAHIGHFVVGDGKYGDNAYNKKNKIKTQRLCAYKITLSFDKEDYLYYLNGKTFSCGCDFYTFGR